MKIFSFEISWNVRDKNPVAETVYMWEQRIKHKLIDEVKLLMISVSVEYVFAPDILSQGEAVERWVKLTAVMNDGQPIVTMYRDDRAPTRHLTEDDLVSYCHPTGYFARNLQIDAQDWQAKYNVPVVVQIPQLAAKEKISV